MQINWPEIKQRLRNCRACLCNAYWALTYPSDVFGICYFATSKSVMESLPPEVQEEIEYYSHRSVSEN